MISLLQRAFGLAPESLRIERHVVPRASGTEGHPIRLLHLTDLHLKRFGPLEERVVTVVHELQPDCITLTGDYIDEDEALDALPPLLRGLRRVAPVYAVLGDNDFESDVRRQRLLAVMRQSGVRVLRNEAVHLFPERGGLTLLGVDDPNTRRADLPGALREAGRLRAAYEASEAAPYVVLAHSPEIALQADRRVSLYLTGHTHGGQICLPGGIALATNTRGIPRYASGRYSVEGGLLYVNRGVGTARIHIRVFCPPEIAVFDIV